MKYSDSNGDSIVGVHRIPNTNAIVFEKTKEYTLYLREQEINKKLEEIDKKLSMLNFKTITN